MAARWRLIVDGDRPAAYNMALDEAIMRTCADGTNLPTLRMYGWSKPSVSLGFFQSLDRSDIDVDCCRDAGISLVRRPTGGRAVVHGHDLTFSISLRESDLPDGYRSIRGSHSWLMSGIMSGLRLLGVKAEIGPGVHGGAEKGSPADCFAKIAECDLRAGSSKLSGAAQVRKWGVLLEQGSIPHSRPTIDYACVFGGMQANGAGLPVVRAERHEMERAVRQGFEESMGVSLILSDLSDRELALAKRLEKSRYSADEWTYRLTTLRIDNNI